MTVRVRNPSVKVFQLHEQLEWTKSSSKKESEFEAAKVAHSYKPGSRNSKAIK